MNLRSIIFAAFVVVCGFGFSQERTSEGLRTLYDFANAKGDIVKDRAGNLDLKINNLGSVKRTTGALEIHGDARIRSLKPASQLVAAAKKSQAMTIEAWIRPANETQEGPARIITLSQDANERNFTVGQEKNRYEVRFRTSKTSRNGQPTVETGDLKLALTHVVYVREKSGVARLFVNGKQRGERNVGGDLNPWNGNLHLALGDEMNGGRQWRGTYFLVAIFDRSLSAEEVGRHFQAGVDGEIPPPTLTKTEPKPKPVAAVAPIPIEEEGTSLRSRKGLQLYYDFAETGGEIIHDRSGSGEAINLKIEDLSKVKLSAGTLEVIGSTKIISQKPANRLTQILKKSNEATIEAWIRPSNLEQEGPARIVTLSRDTSNRSFTLGQEKDFYEMRFRTTKTSGNGSAPETRSPEDSVKTALTHVVYTREEEGRARIYLNGRKVNEEQIPGEMKQWDGSLKFGLANEMTGERPFLGTFYLVAVFDRALTPGEVSRHYRAGANGKSGGDMLTKSENEKLFETQIAPMIAEHCLECHDPSNREGKLDLTRKALAFAGGKRNGPGIVAGKHSESSIWQSVFEDEMPEDRDPLSDEEKALLKKWIDGGASWTISKIDPAVYANGGGETASKIWVQRLTQSEYIETVRAATGVDIEKEARELLPPDLRADGFSNTAYNLNVDLKHVGAYSRLAELIVSQMNAVNFARKFEGSQSLADDKGMKRLIDNMGRRLLRGPMTTEEIYGFRGILTTVAAAGGDYNEAVSYLLEAMLQSPRFIYRVERQRGDGTVWPVNDFELASRMSYIVWGGPPDEKLLNAADSGSLSDPKKLAAEIARMLSDERAVKRSRQFAAEWLNLGRLKNLAPDPEKFPNWNPELADAMLEETLDFFEHVVWDERKPLSELLNTQVTFVNPQLAEFYGFEKNPDAAAKKYDLSDNPERGGLLTHASVLTIGGDEASMVSRGLFVMHDLLRGVVKDPPPCVDVTPVPSKPGVTQRTIARDRVASVSCGGCHAKFEPLAYGLEKFDGIGAFHVKDEFGNELREDGEILIPGEAEKFPYKNARELSDLLAKSDRVKETLTWKLGQFALGRPLTPMDAPIVEKVHTTAMKNGGTYQSTVAAILTSDLVRTTRTEKSD